MFMSDDKKKKASSLILSKMKPNGEEESSEEAPKNDDGDQMDSEAGHMAAAEDIMSAVESKDAKALKAALKSFVEMCQYEAPETEQE